MLLHMFIYIKSLIISYSIYIYIVTLYHILYVLYVFYFLLYI